MNQLIYSDDCKLMNAGNIKWPENNGCKEVSEEKILIVPFNYKKSGMKPKENIVFLRLIDRFGSLSGFYFGDAGVTWKERSLPWFQNNNECKEKFKNFIKNQEYNQYIVLKEFKAYTCTIAPAFGGNGGARQYRSEMSIQSLLKKGIIQQVNKQEYIYPNFEFGKRTRTKCSSISINSINKMMKYLSTIR